MIPFLSFIWENESLEKNTFWRREDFIIALNGFNKRQANILGCELTETRLDTVGVSDLSFRLTEINEPGDRVLHC